MRCDLCKFWKQEAEEWEAEAVGFRQCTAVRPRWRIQDEASTNMEWDAEPEGKYMASRRNALKAAKAYVQDGSEYRAELYTAPDFYCALFVPSPPGAADE